MATLSFFLGVVGNVLSVLAFASPVTTFWRIVKKKSTEDFNALPYVCTLLSTSLWTYYGLIKPGALLIVTVNAAGAALEAIFVTLYLIYSPREGKRTVIVTKSVEFMPFFMSFFLFLNGGVWAAYAVLVRDPFVGIPNGIGFGLGAAQLILYMMYRKWKPNSEEQQGDDQKEVGSVDLEMAAFEELDSRKSLNNSLLKGWSLQERSPPKQNSRRKIRKTLSL